MSLYPEEYTDDEKVLYDELILKGQSMIGNKIKRNESYLVELSARMTIFQIKHKERLENMTQIEKEEEDKKYEDIRLLHEQQMQQQVHYTPIDLFEPGKNPLELNKEIIDLQHNDTEDNNDTDKLSLEFDEKISHIF